MLCNVLEYNCSKTHVYVVCTHGWEGAKLKRFYLVFSKTMLLNKRNCAMHEVQLISQFFDLNILEELNWSTKFVCSDHMEKDKIQKKVILGFFGHLKEKKSVQNDLSFLMIALPQPKMMVLM